MPLEHIDAVEDLLLALGVQPDKIMDHYEEPEEELLEPEVNLSAPPSERTCDFKKAESSTPKG